MEDDQARPFTSAQFVFYFSTGCQRYEHVSFMTPVLSVVLQELIEVDSDVVFELASFILQVRLIVCACGCLSGCLFFAASTCSR